MRATAPHQLIYRGRLPAASRRQRYTLDGLERQSGRTASTRSGITPSTIMSPAPSQPGPWTEIRLGARAHEFEALLPDAHAPPPNFLPPNTDKTDSALTRVVLDR
jgi:hypothetical protein